MEKDQKSETKCDKKSDDACAVLYDSFEKKYSLPDFEFMQKEFDIVDFESKFVLKEIREKLKDKFDYSSKVIETLFQPEGDFSSFLETKRFENGVKDEYFTAYKRLRFLVREAQTLYFKNDDSLDSDYIKNSLKSWEELKPVLIDLMEKFKSCWTDEGLKDDVKYFG